MSEASELHKNRACPQCCGKTGPRERSECRIAQDKTWLAMSCAANGLADFRVRLLEIDIMVQYSAYSLCQRAAGIRTDFLLLQEFGYPLSPKDNQDQDSRSLRVTRCMSSVLCYASELHFLSKESCGRCHRKRVD